MGLLADELQQAHRHLVCLQLNLFDALRERSDLDVDERKRTFVECGRQLGIRQQVFGALSIRVEFSLQHLEVSQRFVNEFAASVLRAIF